ncbi:MAG TPA: hypothetical protein VK859_00620 [bacterium]|jgi:hypothetical protein|nr:hypothetical protein [bacterium]
MDEITSRRNQILEGMGIVLAILFALFLLAYAVFDTWANWGPNGPTDDWTTAPMLALGFCGMSQLVYVIPCFLFFRKKNQPHVARGVLYGAALVLSANLLVYFLWIKGTR